MKEKIKELMRQAGTDSSGKWLGVDNVEKLVELVARECAEICLEANDYKNILRHFNIKE